MGRIFGTPLIVEGWTWLPLTQGFAWLGLAWWLGNRRPHYTRSKRLAVGALAMPLVLGSEWIHNLSHAAAADLTGKNMDALRVTWGMPMVIYHQVDDLNVSPEEHIIRSLGGPVINTALLMLSLLLRSRTTKDSVGRDLCDAALRTNVILVGVGLLPLPFLDGGPILKWSLVRKGRTRAQAGRTVRAANGLTGAALGAGSAVLLKQRRWILGGFLGMLAGLSLAVSSGLLKETSSSLA